MKEGIGGTFMIYVFLVFLTVYITFVAVAFNYARAFKVKNKVIDIIEQNEGVNFSNIGGAIGDIKQYLTDISYNVSDSVNSGNCPDYVDDDHHYFNNEFGYCLQEIASYDDELIGKYYKVTTFIVLKIPFLDLGFTIPVKGETRVIERFNT